MSGKVFRPLLVLVALLGILGFFGSTNLPIAHAASIVVDSTADDTLANLDANTTCDLREAITNANDGGATYSDCAAGTVGADTITFSVSGTITLGSSLPGISDDVTIDGTGQSITVDGATTYQVLSIAPLTVVELSSFTIANGFCNSCDGGAIQNGGTLTVTAMTFLDNVADINGGAITSAVSLTVRGSTFVNNSATTLDGGAIHIASGSANIADSTFRSNFVGDDGGGINNDGILTVTGSTFSGNGAHAGGGGIASNGTSVAVTNSTFFDNIGRSAGGGIHTGAGTTTVTNSTLFGNWGAFTFGGGGISNFATTNLFNTIVANSLTGGDCFNLGGAALTADPFNIDTDGTCDSATQYSTPQVNLGALANYGGPTETMALLAGSVALDAADDAVCNVAPVSNLDQRGVARPITACDVGAFERLTPTFAPGGVNGAMLWLRSDMGVTGSPVSQWADQSASSFVAGALNSSEEPAFFSNTFNGNPALQFDGNSDVLYIQPGILGTGSYPDGNVYLVVRTNTVQSSYTFYEIPANGAQFSTHTPWSDNNIYWDFPYPANRIAVNWGGSTGVPYLWSLLASTTSTPLGNNKHIVRDGTSLANDNSSATLLGSGAPFHVGTGFDGAWHFYNGDYAELVVFLAPLTAAQHNQIESYLSTKYGITLGSTGNLISYTASDGSTIFWTGDATYQNDVAGIGRDDGSKLDQRVSSSVNTAPQPKIANGVTLDNTNPGTNTAFGSDLSFVMWGSNAGTTTLDVPVSASGVNTRIARVWKTQVTGAGVAKSLTLQIPESIFGSNTNPSLLISTDPTFASVTRAPIAMTCSLGTCTATFNPFTAGEYFTFAAQTGTTAVDVTGVNGAINKKGNIIVKWRTTSESQIAGFNVYRKTGKGEWIQVNANFIQAKNAGSAQGNKYRVADKNAKQGKTYRYKIEVKYLDNHSEWTKIVKVKTP